MEKALSRARVEKTVEIEERIDRLRETLAELDAGIEVVHCIGAVIEVSAESTEDLRPNRWLARRRMDSDEYR